MLRNAFCIAVALASHLMLSPLAEAAISPGTPTTSVPSSLFDPLGSLSSPLPAGEFLLPIEITGVTGLQDWSFDLHFDASAVNPIDGGGLYQAIYQTAFNIADPTLSNITSSGFSFAGSLDGIAGFSSGVSGDGLLAYVLFEFLAGQAGNDPDFSVVNETIVQQAPEPATLVLFGSALLLLGRVRVARRTR